MTKDAGGAGQRYRTVTRPGRAASGLDRSRTRIGLGSAGREADEGLAGPRHQLGEVDRPADPDHAVAEKYGVWGEKSYLGKKYLGVNRSTFVIDETGTIKKVFEKVKPVTHADDVLAALASD